MGLQTPHTNPSPFQNALSIHSAKIMNIYKPYKLKISVSAVNVHMWIVLKLAGYWLVEAICFINMYQSDTKNYGNASYDTMSHTQLLYNYNQIPWTISSNYCLRLNSDNFPN